MLVKFGVAREGAWHLSNEILGHEWPYPINLERVPLDCDHL
jgi:hypothetical protein